MGTSSMIASIIVSACLEVVFDKARRSNFLLLLFVVLTVSNAVYSFAIGIHLFFLSENQAFYIFSSLAQVVAALLGLVIAAYGMVDSKTQNMDEGDDSYEYRLEVKGKLFEALKNVSLAGVLGIALSLISIAMYNFNSMLFDFFSNETILLFIVVLIYVLLFALRLSPKELERTGNKEKTAIESEYSHKKGKNIDFSRFVTEYNRFEQLLIIFARHVLEKRDPQAASMIKKTAEAKAVLEENEILNRQTNKIMDDIRRYRNALVHSGGDDKSVSEDMYNKLIKISNFLTKLFEVYRENNSVEDVKKCRAYKELYVYVKKNYFTELEERICKCILENRDLSIREMSEYNLSPESYYRTKKRLQDYIYLYKGNSPENKGRE